MRRYDPLIEELKSRLSEPNTILRVACDENAFNIFPAILLGRLQLLVIVESPDRRASFLAFMQRRGLQNYPIDVEALCREELADSTISGGVLDFLIVVSANKSIEEYLKRLLRAPVKEKTSIQIWCLKGTENSFYSLVRKKRWQVTKKWAKSELFYKIRKTACKKEKREVFRDDESLEEEQ